MSISFNDLPSKREQTNGITTNKITPGRYLCTIKNAELKISAAGNSYLNILLDTQTPEGNIQVYDIISESEKPLARYKLQRFIVSLHMDKTLRNQSFELNDLAKVIKNKKLLADLTMEEEKEDSKYPARPIVDCFTGDIYYDVNQKTIEPEQDLPDNPQDTSDDYPFDLSDNNIDLENEI